VVDYAPLAHALGALGDRHCEQYAILSAGKDARRAYDLWHILGGGMIDRQTDRHTPTLAALEANP
jgi:hypothetical protein